jgi:c-di-GMP-binding flagellar brake protein YcgR
MTPMPMYENIEGPKLLTLFHQLAGDKILITVSLAHSDFESLTVVTRTTKVGSEDIFFIDPPNGLIDAITDSKLNAIHFEFNSEDRVTHRFDAKIKKISHDSVSLLFPHFIQRHQQRDNFRVKVFYESYAKLLIDDTELRMAIDNVSLGGVYCLCQNKHKSKFQQAQILKDMELVMTLDTECLVVPIQKVQVKRFESKPLPKHFGIAFEFLRIKRSPKKLLVQQIYKLQRHFLQNRLKFLE